MQSLRVAIDKTRLQEANMSRHGCPVAAMLDDMTENQYRRNCLVVFTNTVAMTSLKFREY
jgi:hypothetical protein